jgi:hypothetical protein
MQKARHYVITKGRTGQTGLYRGKPRLKTLVERLEPDEALFVTRTEERGKTGRQFAVDLQLTVNRYLGHIGLLTFPAAEGRGVWVYRPVEPFPRRSVYFPKTKVAEVMSRQLVPDEGD